MNIGLFTSTDKKTKEFEELMKTRWNKDFIEDFEGNHISDHKDNTDFKIYIAYNENNILGGCIVSERNILNSFKDPIKTSRKYELQKDGFKNLTYMIVNEKIRGKGIGSKILNFVTNKYSRLWLTCIDELIPFYEKNNFCLHIKRIEGEKVNLMTYKKEAN